MLPRTLIFWVVFFIALKMDEDLLYGDIEDAGKDAEIENLRKLLGQEKKKNEALSGEIVQLKDQITVLVADRQQLETNMMTLFNTAQNDIRRRDNEIASMRGSGMKG